MCASRSFRLVRALLSPISHPILYRIGMAGGYVHYLFAADKRRMYRENMDPAAALRPAPINHAGAFQNHAVNVLEMLKALTEPPDHIRRRVEITGTTHIDRARDAGRGIILATCHFGNWELAGIALALNGYPVTTVAGEQLNRNWSEEVKEWKRSYGITVISSGNGYRKLYRDLEGNRIVVLHIDGDLFTRGVPAAFLGRTKSFPRGPAHISRVMQSPISFAFCRRVDGCRFEVSIGEPMPPPRTGQDEAGITQALVDRMQKCILAEPEQWCIFRSI